MRKTTDKLIILGAGKPVIGSEATPLKEVHSKTRALDWITSGFKKFISNAIFVAGYQSDKIVSSYTNLDLIINSNWASTGSLGSLYKIFTNISKTDSYYICYSDVLFRNSVIEDFSTISADVIVAVDSNWTERFSRDKSSLKKAEKVSISEFFKPMAFSYDRNPKDSDVEFAGLVKLSTKALKIVDSLKAKFGGNKSKKQLPDLLNALLSFPELKFKLVDVANNWTELDDPRDLAKFILGTKAQTLNRLQNLVKHCQILDQVSFTVDEWTENNQLFISKIQTKFPEKKLIVRSSSLTEDGFSSANAGAYESILNVESSDDNIATAVKKVILSYSESSKNNQVLVQPMLENVVSSGVVFTRTLSHGAPYICINHTNSSDTTSITSGNTEGDSITYILKNNTLTGNKTNFEKRVQDVVNELENLIGLDSLDIEFAIDQSGVFYVLQVRPIAVDHNDNNFADSEIFNHIALSQKRFEDYETFQGNLHGNKVCYGIMPDWNPAEIIGVTPNKLAASLYKHLITDEIWAQSRLEFGYKDLRSQELMVFFCGRPYIDVRASLNSFVPASVPDSLAEKLVNYSLNHLIANPWLHDKIEFEVIPTCYSLDFPKWEKRLKDAGFNKEEITCLETGLKEISINAINLTSSEKPRIDSLLERFTKISNKNGHPLLLVKNLLSDCKNYGTVAFSNLARCAFVAVAHLKGLVSAGVISDNEKNDFLNSITTVANELLDDSRSVKNNTKSEEDFIAKYSHLRPGTYDILSDSYGSDPKRYLLPIIEQEYHNNDNAFSFTELPKSRQKEIEKHIQIINPQWNIASFEDFLRQSIAMREYYKFAFTKNLSLALDLIYSYCKDINIEDSLIAEIAINDLLDLQSGLNNELNPKKYLEERAIYHSRQSKLAKIIELPPILFDKEQFGFFSFDKVMPNFVSQGSITDDLVFVESSTLDESKIRDKLVLISHADPGFDWIFSCGIKGLITKYGGANSHMAIRCAEFGLPAAIGVGDILFEKLQNAKVVSLDCNNKTIKKVQ